MARQTVLAASTLAAALTIVSPSSVAANGGDEAQSWSRTTLDARLNSWSTEHADNQNTGRSPGQGPGTSAGFCRKQWLKYSNEGVDPISGAPIILSNSGVSATTQSSLAGHYSCDSGGTCRMIGDEGGSLLEIVEVIPEKVFESFSVTEMQGMWASPASMLDPGRPGIPSTKQDWVVVPSLDGHVYVLSQYGCMLPPSRELKQGQGMGQGRVEPAFAAAEEAAAAAAAAAEQADSPWASLDLDLGLSLGVPLQRGRQLEEEGQAVVYTHVPQPRTLQTGGAGACGIWQFMSSEGQPFASPPLISKALGLVIVSETSADLATGGLLHGLNLTTGLEMWSYPVVAGGDSWPLIGVKPAISPLTTTPDAHLIVAYGPAIEVLDSRTGVMITSLENTVASGNCPAMYQAGENFVSSPSIMQVAANEAQIFLHTNRGNVWSYVLTMDGNGSPSLKCEWACTYNYNGGQPPFCNEPDPPAAATAEVAGGWYQGTTTADREELHAALRELYAAKHGAAKAEAVAARYGAGRGTFGGRPIPAGLHSIEASMLARELSLEDKNGLVTPSGYRRVQANGKPASVHSSLGDVFGGVYTRATPAITADSNYLAVPTWGDGQTNSDLGVLVLQTSNGNAASTTTTVARDANNLPINYARSRASAAWDYAGNLYFVADWDFSDVSGVGGFNDTLPALVVLAGADGPMRPALAWAVDLGVEFSPSLGLASPVIVDGADPNSHRLVIAGALGSLHMIKGCPNTCASSVPMVECSGHGVCNGASGNCTCAPAWSSALDPTCSTHSGCDHGYEQLDGTCECAPCWSLDATGRCTRPLDCLNNGRCMVVNGTQAVCQCPWCNSPDPKTGLCTVTRDCGANSNGCAIDTCSCNACFVPSDDGMSCVAQDCGSGTCDSSSGNATCVCDTCYTNDATSGSCTALVDCGPGGYCDVDEGGTCENAGDQCWLYDRSTGKYDTYQLCDGHGTCNDATGHCTCQTGWSNMSIPTPCSSCDACHTGKGVCNQLFACSGNGVCTLGETPTHRVCVCAPGWTGAICDTPAPNNAPAGGVSPAVAAGVGVPVALLGAAALGFYLMRVRKTGGYARLTIPGSSGGFGSASGGMSSSSDKLKGGGSGSGSGSGGGGFQSTGASAPRTFAAISKGAGFDTEAARAAVARLGTVSAGKGGARDAPKDTSALLASRPGAKPATGLAGRSGGGYGGL